MKTEWCCGLLDPPFPDCPEPETAECDFVCQSCPFGVAVEHDFDDEVSHEMVCSDQT